MSAIIKSWANAKDIEPNDSMQQHFPAEGLYVGSLKSGRNELPALVFLNEVNGLCLLYNSDDSHFKANRCIERLLWRIATTVPPNLCELTVYNAGNPGEVLNSAMQINKHLFGKQTEKIYFVGTKDAFDKKLDELCQSIFSRLSTIRESGKGNAVEYNATVDYELQLKYEFVFITDFPRNLDLKTFQKIDMLVQSGSKAGVFVLMTWNMNTKFRRGDNEPESFNPRNLLISMELITPPYVRVASMRLKTRDTMMCLESSISNTMMRY